MGLGNGFVVSRAVGEGCWSCWCLRSFVSAGMSVMIACGFVSFRFRWFVCDVGAGI